MFSFSRNTIHPAGQGLPASERLGALLAVMLAVCMASLDTAIANTALPTIARDLRASDAGSIWVISGYQLAMVAGLLPAAALGEILGHRRVYMVGIVVFTLASLACGLAPTLPVLVAARILQGLGAAGVMSVNAALLRFIYPAPVLGRGMGLNAMVVGLSFAAGPTAASTILLLGSWHWLFLVNVPIGLLAMVLGLRGLPPTTRAPHVFDGLAAALCALTLGLFVLGSNELAHGAPWQRVTLEWGLAAASLWLLMRRQAGHPAPILAVDLLRRPLFALSAATAVCAFAAQALAFVSLPFLFQTVLGYTQVHTGFLITPWPVVVAFMAPIAGRLSDRYPAGMLGGVGLALLALGMASLALLPAAPSAWDISWRMALCGAGFGFFQSPNLRAIMTSAPPSRAGGASGMIGTVRLLGQASGAALVAACFNVSSTHGAVMALWLGGLCAALASLTSFARLRFGAVESADAPAAR
ncbi:MFS transporter [Achromobacter xylosoxidans]|uniref:MFS transporter n=1 Tax=Alcaligenes xylosoxydans xylosoxydans TaxID=85698 RepID=UPI000332199F|nr:MFS transporter [Achromobacter xylosoxidans]CCH05869.1 major facilitator superfamily MFS_1 [Achromobacter xylosoxidans NH44784-1996]